MTLSRRQFIGIAAACVAGAGSISRAAAGGKSLVSFCRSSDHAVMLEKALKPLGGWKRFVRPGALVALKPNASFANPPDWGNNTSPELVAAACRQILSAGARKVVVVDYPLMHGARALEDNGVAEACREMDGVELLVLGKREQFVPVKVKGRVLTSVEIARVILDADCVINMPVAKAHDAVAASISLKNLMGIIWDRAVFHTSMEINQAIADLASAVRVDLSVVDMTRVMVTNGPKGPGEVVKPGLVAASTDPVALDSWCLGQVRFNRRRWRPAQVRYLRYAHEAGLGQLSRDRIQVVEVPA